MSKVVPATEELKTYLDVSFNGESAARNYILSHTDEEVAANVTAAFGGLVDFKNRDVVWAVQESRNKILLDADHDKASLLNMCNFWKY